VLDPMTAAVDSGATRAARSAERAARISRGRPYAEFVRDWETAAPPAHLPFFGSWSDPKILFRGSPEDTCQADAIVPVMMPDPKDVRIAELEAELARKRLPEAVGDH
jgi:acetone carboxylase, alpha subunit